MFDQSDHILIPNFDCRSQIFEITIPLTSATSPMILLITLQKHIIFMNNTINIQNSHQFLNYFGQSALLCVILLPQLLYIPIDSEQILVHILHLLPAALASGPVVVVQDVPATGRQSIKFLLHLKTLPQSTAEKPGRFLLHPESQEIQCKKNNSNSQESILYRTDL